MEKEFDDYSFSFKVFIIYNGKAMVIKSDSTKACSVFWCHYLTNYIHFCFLKKNNEKKAAEK